MISRRTFVATATAAILAAPLSGEAQQAGRVYRVGYLGTRSASTPEGDRIWAAFRQGLSELGWIEGQNLAIERRSSEGVLGRFPELAAELVRLKVDVITTAAGWAAVRALKQATTTTPIVMLSIGDPVAGGFVASLARPGGNITGIADLSGELTAKRLESLKEILPGIARVAHLVCPVIQEIPANTALRGEQVASAKALGISLRFVDVKNSQDFAHASAAVIRERPEALLLGPCPIIFDLRRQIAEFALTHHLPTVAAHREAARAGALMSYGSDVAANFRRGAAFVDKILRGAKPADLPVEQSTTFDVVINLKTAK
ncbi:MAG TPA: ABC transporter substrate-binding protein, partial [Dehalococcoidia bacterium]|nr:ABC transporter substrate-binding protein [Dehalococcoidia bacterium]